MCECRLSERYQDASWFFFANEETQVDFTMLRKVLARYNPQEVGEYDDGIEHA